MISNKKFFADVSETYFFYKNALFHYQIVVTIIFIYVEYLKEKNIEQDFYPVYCVYEKWKYLLCKICFMSV